MERSKFWNRDFSSFAAYEKSIQANRERLRRMLGAVDARTPAAPAEAGSDAAIVAQSETFTVETARWAVFPGVHGEGLLLRPRTAPVACIVAIPDADQTPEMAAGLAPGLAGRTTIRAAVGRERLRSARAGPAGPAGHGSWKPAD